MKRNLLPTTKCESCIDGLLPGPGAGPALRREREERGVPRVSKAHPPLGLAHHMGYSEAYISDLEQDARSLSWKMVAKYRAAIDAAVAERVKEGQ